MSLDKELLKSGMPMTLRKTYLDRQEIIRPIPFLAIGFGIALAIVTRDRKLIISRRSELCGARPNELDVSIVEGVHPALDTSESNNVPDLYSTATRGSLEELGIHLKSDEISFLGFGVDLKYYQWNLIGIGRCSFKARDILQSISRGACGKWEARSIEFIDFEPDATLSYLKGAETWSTAVVATYWALVNEYGKERTRCAADGIFTS
jgi:hypothetical protein